MTGSDGLHTLRAGDPHPDPGLGDSGVSERLKWADLLGAAPDFTGGQDVNEYLDESRGDA